MAFLLDTNVVSETIKPIPEPRVVAFLNEQEDLWSSVVVLHELEYGLRLLPHGHQRESLEVALSAFVDGFADRVLPIDGPEALQAATFRVQTRSQGRALHLADALIAGTAKVHGLAIATRNVRDFVGLDVDVINPWVDA